MVKKHFVCKKCHYTFEAEIMDSREAEAKRLRLVPVRCPQCKTTDVVERA